MFQTEWVDGDGLRLNLASHTQASQVDSNKPPLLFLHGVARRWRTFAPLFGSLAPRWSIHALDHRGHGDSERGAGYRVVDYVADARVVLEKRFDRPVVVYGHSLGSLVAIAVAAAIPEKVAAIVLEDPPAPSLLTAVDRSPYFPLFSLFREMAGSSLPTGALAKRLAESRLASPDGGPPKRLGDLRDAASLRFMAGCLKSLDPETMTPLLGNRWMEAYDWQDALAQVASPALLLRGDPALGGMLDRETSQTIAQTIADATVIDLPGVGHNIHAQATELGLRYLHPFLESL